MSSDAKNDDDYAQHQNQCLEELNHQQQESGSLHKSLQNKPPLSDDGQKADESVEESVKGRPQQQQLDLGGRLAAPGDEEEYAFCFAFVHYCALAGHTQGRAMSNLFRDYKEDKNDHGLSASLLQEMHRQIFSIGVRPGSNHDEHCASRRSLRDDPKYDELISALYPDIEKYEEEETAFHEEERIRNEQYSLSWAAPNFYSSNYPPTIRGTRKEALKGKEALSARAIVGTSARRWEVSRSPGRNNGANEQHGSGA
ncbi:putative E3 ubiquitin-protein ligase RING1a [Daucus carota subsp. sativus]|uniref:putative E3 ubiquitin-protein ligase RING1a n=1 Tax=Daucus carota subsp. sativus TaxID=79200 RepID=UPI003083C555